MTLQHTGNPRNFGIVYTNPQCGYILCRVNIGVNLKVAVATLKRFAVSFTNVVATRTSFRSISRWHKNNWNPSNGCLVACKQPQLVESPIVSPSTFSLVSRFFIQTVSDAGQVFKSNSCTQRFSIIDQSPTNVMVDPTLKPTFSALEPSQKSTTRPSAFALNVRYHSAVSIPDSLQLLPFPGNTSTGSSNVTTTKVYPNNLGRFPRWLSRQFHYYIDVVTTILTFDQNSTGWNLHL